jgi:hypothetical protein
MIQTPLIVVSKFGRDLGFSCNVAAVAGLLSHALYFIHGFRNNDVVSIILVHAGAGAALAWHTITSLGLSQGLLLYTAISASYFVALFLSIGTYRLFLHRLSRFPGPSLAKISKLYSGPWLARNGKIHEEYFKMHEKYGDFIRTGSFASAWILRH